MRTKHILFLLLAAVLVCLAGPLYAQSDMTIPDEVEIGNLYEGLLDGGREHSFRVSSRGDYVLFMGVDQATLVRLEIPGGEVFEVEVGQERNNLVPFEARRTGEAFLSFELVDESPDWEPFYGFVVVPAETIELGDDLTDDIGDRPIDLPDEQRFYIAAYVFEAPKDGYLRATAFSELAEFQMLMGGVGRFSSYSSFTYSPDEPAELEGSIEEGETFVLLITGATAESTSTEFMIEFEIEDAVAMPEPIDLFFGEEAGGSLSQDLPIVGGKRVLPFVYDGSRGEEIAILMRSPSFDTFLMVETPSGRMISNDDGGGGTDSAVFLELDETGDYVVYASSYSGEVESEDFSVLVTDHMTADEIIAGDDAVGVPPGGEPFPQSGYGTEIVDVQPLEIGDVVEGRVTDDGSIYEGIFVDVFELEVPEGEHVAIEMESPDFGAFLSVEEPDGYRRYGQNGSGQDARLEIIDAIGGVYTIFAGPYDPDRVGEYTLLVEMIELGPPADDVRGARIEDGVTEGEIEQGGPEFEGKIVAVYEYRAQQGENFDVTLESDAFDPYLFVITPSDAVRVDDDGAGNLNSYLAIENAEPGTYRIYPTSFGGRSLGPFVITIALD